jgi:hypothetical protein
VCKTWPLPEARSGGKKIWAQKKCAYNHEPWGDRSLAYPKNEPGGEKAMETLASGMEQQCNRQKEDVDACPTVSLGRSDKVFPTNLIHVPTGHLWRAKLWGYTKTRYERKKTVSSQLNWFPERSFAY